MGYDMGAQLEIGKVRQGRAGTEEEKKKLSLSAFIRGETGLTK
jgi:hypothetical protein